VQLLDENWAHVRQYWALLILWDQWRALLDALTKEQVYVDPSQTRERTSITFNPLIHRFVFVRALTRIQWCGNRIGSLLGADVLTGAGGHCLVLNKLRILPRYTDESATDRTWRLTHIMDPDMYGVMTTFADVQ